MINYKCKCGNEKDFFTDHNLSQCGLYCEKCGKWQKWLNKDEERLFKHKQDLATHDKHIRNEVIIETLESVIKMISDWGYEDSSSVVLIENMKARIKQIKDE